VKPDFKTVRHYNNNVISKFRLSILKDSGMILRR